MCPQPIVKTRQALAGLASGEILEMASTDPGSVPDMAAFCANTGDELLRSVEGDGDFVSCLRKA